ncbi:glutamate carboxypeptidase [Rhodothermaceae bacterium RA]|nr:glutamate carboxypeptidase [Rhodothermaceae bacterium RA]
MLLRYRRPLVCALFLFLLAAPTLHAQQLTGFSPEQAGRQATCEARLQALPTPEAFRRHLEALTREPHPTGSEANARVAAYIADAMARAGLQVERYPYDVYLPTLETDIDVALVTPIRKPLNNQEYILPEDRFSDHPELRPAWNAYSGNGDVTAEVVYANYGRKEDFERLADLGVSVEGKIVLARYGGNFRGYKAKYAEAHGAVGLIIYSDPADGGYIEGLAYPEGPFLNESTVQRGSLLTLDYTGDPLTPFEPALPHDTPGAPERLAPEAVDGFHGIPVAPLPYGSAVEILQRMQGAPVPGGWQGGLPFTYRLTGGPALTVRLRVHQPRALVRATNVIGRIPGSEFPDEWIILGSHYDAWAFGAVDPNGGTAMLLTLAEALGTLATEGCRPRRSILIAHWDAEEYGIIGSTEWAEHLREALTRGAVAYLNADAAVSGSRFGGAASPSLKGLIVEATCSVAYPGTDQTVFDHWQARAPEAAEPPLGNLGGGSDHVAFYTHLGIPSAGLSMAGRSPVYHSNYDNFAWYERFADTSFVYGPALARVDGVLALRLANADVLPYDVRRYATDLATHVAALQRRGREQDLTVSLDRLTAAVAELDTAAAAFEAARQTYTRQTRLDRRELERINQALLSLEKAFIYADGLQGRPWSRSLYASPDPFSGYASWMLPGLRYEIERRDPDALAAWETRYTAAVRDLTERLQALTEQLTPRNPQPSR